MVKTGDIMHSGNISCRACDSVFHALRLIMEENLPGLAVLDDQDRLVGMITEEHIFAQCLPRSVRFFDTAVYVEQTGGLDGLARKLATVAVRTIMSRCPSTVTPVQPLADVAALMEQKNAELLIVMDRGKPAGLIGRRDILRVLAIATVQESGRTGKNVGKPQKNDVY